MRRDSILQEPEILLDAHCDGQCWWRTPRAAAGRRRSPCPRGQSPTQSLGWRHRNATVFNHFSRCCTLQEWHTWTGFAAQPCPTLSDPGGYCSAGSRTRCNNIEKTVRLNSWSWQRRIGMQAKISGLRGKIDFSASSSLQEEGKTDRTQGSVHLFPANLHIWRIPMTGGVSRIFDFSRGFLLCSQRLVQCCVSQSFCRFLAKQ